VVGCNSLLWCIRLIWKFINKTQINQTCCRATWPEVADTNSLLLGLFTDTSAIAPASRLLRKFSSCGKKVKKFWQLLLTEQKPFLARSIFYSGRLFQILLETWKELWYNKRIKIEMGKSCHSGISLKNFRTLFLFLFWEKEVVTRGISWTPAQSWKTMVLLGPENRRTHDRKKEKEC
jgi:hypothetical protein